MKLLKCWYLHLTQVRLLPYLALGLTDWFCWDLADVTLADEDADSQLIDNVADVWPRFQSLVKLLLWTIGVYSYFTEVVGIRGSELLLWTIGVYWHKVLNALGPLCPWQYLICFCSGSPHILQKINYNKKFQSNPHSSFLLFDYQFSIVYWK